MLPVVRRTYTIEPGRFRRSRYRVGGEKRLCRVADFRAGPNRMPRRTTEFARARGIIISTTIIIIIIIIMNGTP